MRICLDTVIRALIATVICLSAGVANTDELSREGGCAHGLAELGLTLLADGSVGVDYALNRATRSLRLDLPSGRSENFRLEPAEASMDTDGVVVVPNATRRFRIVVFPDRPEQRRAAEFPPAFNVEGRGTAVYLPYLLPEDCGEVRVLVQGGRGMAAVVDGAYHRVENDYQIVDPDGFVLLGHDLLPKSIIQFPKAMPAWLEEAIRESYERGQEGVTDFLGIAREDVPLFVDFSAEGAGASPQNGGDAPGDHCAIRLWFRGEAWQSQRVDLGARMNDVLVHELVHCYQKPENWRRWAHEGHARFVEYFLAARPDGEYSPGNRIEKGFSRDFDACMDDLRVGERRIDPYACGSVAYWLRWLQTDRVNMLAKADADHPTEARTMAGRFLKRTPTETDVVDFLRSAGIAVQVVDDPSSVRERLIKTLIRQSCGELSSVGYWTHETFVTLDAPGCPELNGFELQAIAGRDIFEDVHLSYAAVAVSCRDEGRVLAIGVDGEQKWVRCDRSYEWPSTTESRYRLVAPFADRGDRDPATRPGYRRDER